MIEVKRKKEEIFFENHQQLSPLKTKKYKVYKFIIINIYHIE